MKAKNKTMTGRRIEKRRPFKDSYRRDKAKDTPVPVRTE